MPIQLQTTADFLLYSAMRIVALKDGQPISTGTGFFFTFQFDQGDCNVIITNNHVVEGADAIQMRLHMKNEAGEMHPTGGVYTMSVDGYFKHPDPGVDLCMLGASDLVNYRHEGWMFSAMSLAEIHIPSEKEWQSFDSIEGVWMIGCPNGIYDAANNLPITRSGITASNPRLHYQGKPEFVVDMACFPGSSGSPIYRAANPMRFDRGLGGTALGAVEKTFLMGILYAGPMITNTGQIVLSQNPQVEVASMMHLGYAIKSNRILDFKPIVTAALGM